VLFDVQPGLTGYKSERLASLFPELERRLSALPGVASVGYSAVPLLSGSYTMWMFCLADQSAISAYVLDVGPNFIETMRLPLLAGRTYNTHDLVNFPDKKPNVVIVNRAFARRLFGTHNPIGRSISIEEGKSAGMEIVGVVGDAKYYSLRQEVEPTAYFLMRPGGGTFEVRTASDPRALFPSIRSALRSLDRDLPVSHFTTQTEQVDRTIFQERLLAWLSGAFGLLALVVTCIGLYGTLAFEVTRRTHEVGVRMALGASPKKVLGLVLGRGIRLVALGILIGIGASLGLTRYLQSLLFGVRPIDPLAYAVVTALLSIVTFGACFIPARRATKVDPMVALRYE
jgi:predicted permease